MYRLAQLVELSEGKMRNADADGIRQNHQLKYDAPLPSPHPQAELPTRPKFNPRLSSLRTADVFPVREGEKRRPEIRLLFAGYSIFVAFQNKRKGYPTTCVRKKNLAEMESSKNAFISKEKRTVYFLGQHMTKHST